MATEEMATVLVPPVTKETDLSKTKDDTDRNSDSIDEHTSLKYSLLGPSLTKAGQDSVDQSKVSEIIYEASKGSKFFHREEEKDKILTGKVERILAKKAFLEKVDLTRDLRAADTLIAQLELSRDLSQHIVHLDCDAFYAAVELLDRPELHDKPFAVGGGVLTTCNYIARKFGCRSGMAGFVAKKLCPDLVLLPLNFTKYTAKATEVREVLAQYDPRFESASIDEAYLNITEYCSEHNAGPAEVVEQMRAEIYEKTKITVSAGIAANSKLAKICSNMNKPNGQFVLPSDRAAIMAFMRDLPCRKVNGVGRVFERELAAVGIKTCGDIYGHRQYLNQLFGEKAYEFLLHCYLGLGRTNIQPAEEYERKSVGTERTFKDMSDSVTLREQLRKTAEELEKDMAKAECKGRTLVLKIKLHTYEVYTRQVTTPKAVCVADDLYRYSLPILNKLMQEIPGMTLRLMGLRCTHLVSTKKPDTLAFFGLKPKRTASTDSAEQSDGTQERKGPTTVPAQWEQWPEEMLDNYEIDMPRDGSPNDAGEPSPSRHGKEIRANPTPKKKDQPQAEEEWWDCPICSRPQAADARQFNEHIDLCLSRQAIRDTVQQEALSSESSTPESSKKPRIVVEKKRGRPSHGGGPDPKQKKLCFG
jgi:DNA polymerase kappa